MKKLILSVFLCFTTFLYGNGSNYRTIDNQSLTVPSDFKTVNEIATYLVRNLTTPVDKTRAIYFWISNNIRYDLTLLNSKRTYDNTQLILDEVLKNRKGVCQHYAELFKACCDAVGVQSYVIAGYTDQGGNADNFGHAWNAVRIDGNYYGIDVTWAAGHLENGKYKFEFNNKYFLVTPSEFIKSHFPYDPIWQFSSNPLTHKEIEKSDFRKLNTKANFNFHDSIKAQSTLSQLEVATGVIRRISKFGITNQLIKKEVAHNQQLVVSLRFNAAVELYNKAVANYNSYVLYKNKQFQNTDLSDKELMDFITSAKIQLRSSGDLIRFLNSDSSSLNKSLNDMELSMEKLNTDLERELAFMKKYIKTLKPFRLFLFLSTK